MDFSVKLRPKINIKRKENFRHQDPILPSFLLFLLLVTGTKSTPASSNSIEFCSRLQVDLEFDRVFRDYILSDLTWFSKVNTFIVCKQYYRLTLDLIAQLQQNIYSNYSIECKIYVTKPLCLSVCPKSSKLIHVIDTVRLDLPLLDNSDIFWMSKYF